MKTASLHLNPQSEIHNPQFHRPLYNLSPMKEGMFPLLLLLAAGCSNPQPYVTAPRMAQGLVIVLPGIEGPSRFNRAICFGLAEGGVDYAIETYDWTSFLGPLYNLRASTRNHRQADYVADLVIRYHMNYPGRPVYLVGHSGGGAIAVWTAELLPSEHKVDGIILLAASLSPHYMLDAGALPRSRQGIVSFYSGSDWVLLGTNLTGTMDGEMATSAGRTGFLDPQSGPRPKEYSRLFQVPWDRQMSRAGNTGGHLTSGAAGFVAKYVAPLITLPHWDEQSIEHVMANGSGVKSGAGVAQAASQPGAIPARTAAPQTPPGAPPTRPGPPPSAPPAPATAPAPVSASRVPSPPTPSPAPKRPPLVPWD
jgi:pimeloyl-ACP methyl ester carboxylesterase